MRKEDLGHLTQSTPHPASGQLLPNAEKEIAVEPFIDKREVARRLGRTIRSVDNLMRDGVIPFYKFDARVAFRWSEIQQRLAQTFRVSKRVG